MYDIELKKELLEFKVGSDTIEDLQYRYEQIIKIIINRTTGTIPYVNNICT